MLTELLHIQEVLIKALQEFNNFSFSCNMMKFTCLVTLGLFVAVQSASLFLKPIDIPVKVIYDDDDYNTHQTVIFKNFAGSRNLNEKIQISPADVRQLSKFEDSGFHGNRNSVKNLDAKVQLSLEDLRQAEKHLPLENGKEDGVDLKSNSVEENLNTVANPNQNSGAEIVKPEETEKPTESVNLLEPAKPIEKPEETVKPEETEKPAESVNPAKPNETIFGILGEAPAAQEPVTAQPVAAPSTTTEENLPDPNVVLLIQIAQNIVASGLTSIRENIDDLAITNEDGNKNPPITSEQWNRLNQTIQNFFATLLDRGTTKASNQNILHDIVTGIRSVMNNFLQSLRTQVSESFKDANPQTPGASQTIINLFTSGFQQITENIDNIPNQSTTKNTVAGDVDVTTTSPRPIQEIISQVQQFFGGQSTSNTSHVLPIQSDTPETPGGPFEAFQNVANQVGQVFNNLNPFNPSSTAAPGSQGDDAPGNPLQSIQTAANQVGQAINNLNPFRPSSAAPGAQADSPTTLNPLQSFQNAANQVGQAINNLNPFNQASTAAPGSQGDSPTTANPLQSFQNAANQVGQAINNLNPFRPGSAGAPGSQNEETTNGPFQAVQNVVNQVGQAVNNFINQGSAPAAGAQNEESSSTPLPIQQAFQNVANQIGSAINNLNPFNSPSTPATNLQSDGATTQNRPFQGVQNVIGFVSTLSPLNQASTAIPVSNPLQGAQNVINQVGQAASGLNPLNQGSSTPSSPISGSLQTIQAIGSQGQQLLGGQSSVNPVDSIQSVISAVNKPADPVSGAVETIQSIGSEITNPEKKPVPEEKAVELLSEQEIMVAVD